MQLRERAMYMQRHLVSLGFFWLTSTLGMTVLDCGWASDLTGLGLARQPVI